LSRKCPAFVQVLSRNCPVFVQKNTHDLMQLIENQQTKITPTLGKEKTGVIVQKKPPGSNCKTANCKL